MTKMNIKQLIWDIFFKNDDEFVKKNTQYDDELSEAHTTIMGLVNEIELLRHQIDDKDTRIAVSSSKQESSQDDIEKYWNNKRKKTNWVYPGRPNPTDPDKRVFVDPRIFYQQDHTLPTYSGTNDEIASKCLHYVNLKIKYTKDDKDYWQFAYETRERKKGDCEDGAILMVNMMIMSGIPYWRVRLNAGKVKGGGHTYVTYLREENNEWYILDWCYWYKESKNFGKKWDDAEKYFTIWGSWNQKYVFW